MKLRVDLRMERGMKEILEKYRENSLTTELVLAVGEYINNHYDITEEERIILKYITQGYIK